ncbi:MAG: succinate dehydrogenase [Polyangiaceae bacterium]|nr:succinate dehydrogenase [Polyangiaceae bacterium]
MRTEGLPRRPPSPRNRPVAAAARDTAGDSKRDGERSDDHAEPAGSPGAQRRGFVTGRLASVLAIAPLGVWTVDHVYDNLAVFRGAREWEQAVTGHSHPIALAVTSFVVLAPLFLHTVWGLGRVLSSKPNNGRYATFANLKYLLQRLSAVGVMLFLGAHVWLAFLRPRFVLGHAETFADISREMHHHGPTLIVYLLGTLGVAYHLANGIYGFAMGWGLVASRASLKKIERASLVFFVLLLAMCWGAIYGLWRAGA